MRRDRSTDEEGWPLCTPKPPPVVREVLDVPEAMRFLRVGRSALYRLVARRQIPHRLVGKQVRFSRAALVAWLSAGPEKR